MASPILMIGWIFGRGSSTHFTEFSFISVDSSSHIFLRTNISHFLGSTEIFGRNNVYCCLLQYGFNFAKLIFAAFQKTSCPRSVLQTEAESSVEVGDRLVSGTADQRGFMQMAATIRRSG
jgi:hypothetical protein